MADWLNNLSSNINPDYNKKKGQPFGVQAPTQHPDWFGNAYKWLGSLGGKMNTSAGKGREVVNSSKGGAKNDLSDPAKAFGDTWSSIHDFMTGKTMSPAKINAVKPFISPLAQHVGLSGGIDHNATNAEKAALLAKTTQKFSGSSQFGEFTGTSGGKGSKAFGSSSMVQMNKNKKEAIDNAMKSVVGKKTGGGTGKDTQPLTQPPTPMQINADPSGALKNFELQKETAYGNIDAEFKPQEDSLHQNYASVVAGYQDEKKKSLAGAEAEYARANPYGSGSDKEMFMEAISKNYDGMIAQAGKQFGDQMNKLTADKRNAKADVDTQYETQISEYKANVATEIGDYMKTLKEEGSTAPSAYELQDILSKAVSAGLDPIMVLGEINNSYAAGAAKTRKTEAQLAHQNFMEEHTLRMEALSEARLAASESGSSKPYSPTEIEKLKAMYPKANIDIGMTADDVMSAVQSAPKFELKSNWWSGDKKFEEVGITAENLDVIRSYLGQGAMPDDIFSLMPGLTEEGKTMLLDSFKQITA